MIATATTARYGEMEFRDVGKVFGAGDRARVVLDGCSFVVSRGKLNVLIGPSGCGKTTIVNLLAGYERPTRGEVRLDAEPVRGPSSTRLVVFQETALFDATIEENLRVGGPAASDTELRRAARSAGADEFIRALPEGYQTPLGRSGGKLSGGQRQRLAIARALVRGPRVLILDEPTSALDPETEQRLLDTLREASRERAVLVIAHRLSTVRHADTIAFVEAGRILERGSHDALMARPSGAYRRFVELQSRGAT